MNAVKTTRHFEEWLGHHTDVVNKDLRVKHLNMKMGIFLFLRATFYRWAQIWPKVCPDLAKGPLVLAVGDLHVENFGTWRDAEGRLTWGVNDFDEAHPLRAPGKELRLLRAMGWETANIHLGAKSARKSILSHLQ